MKTIGSPAGRFVSTVGRITVFLGTCYALNQLGAYFGWWDSWNLFG